MSQQILEVHPTRGAKCISIPDTLTYHQMTEAGFDDGYDGKDPIPPVMKGTVAGRQCTRAYVCAHRKGMKAKAKCT